VISRLVSLGSVLVDIVLDVPRLPERGGDVLANPRGMTVGGAFNVMSAASRLGLACVYAGPHGTGVFGDLVRTALDREGIEPVCARNPDVDTGWTVALIEPDGERTFVTATGADAIVSREAIGGLEHKAADAVYVSGYDLAYPAAGEAIADHVARLDPATFLVFDPGPLAADIAPATLEPVVRRAAAITLNERELDLLGGADALRAPRRTLVVRGGPRGATVLRNGEQPVQVPAVRVERVVDTSGAGDVHTGAMLAGLARGLDIVAAVGLANRAAAYAVSRPGPASGPTDAELAEFMAGRV
jgi:sugar/nucleoside kinase (ribokinase family)